MHPYSFSSRSSAGLRWLALFLWIVCGLASHVSASFTTRSKVIAPPLAAQVPGKSHFKLEIDTGLFCGNDPVNRHDPLGLSTKLNIDGSVEFFEDPFNSQSDILEIAALLDQRSALVAKRGNYAHSSQLGLSVGSDVMMKRAESRLEDLIKSMDTDIEYRITADLTRNMVGIDQVSFVKSAYGSNPKESGEFYRQQVLHDDAMPGPYWELSEATRDVEPYLAQFMEILLTLPFGGEGAALELGSEGFAAESMANLGKLEKVGATMKLQYSASPLNMLRNVGFYFSKIRRKGLSVKFGLVAESDPGIMYVNPFMKQTAWFEEYLHASLLRRGKIPPTAFGQGSALLNAERDVLKYSHEVRLKNALLETSLPIDRTLLRYTRRDYSSKLRDSIDWLEFLRGGQ